MYKLFPIIFGLITSIGFTQKNPHIRMLYQETVCPPEWIIYDQPDSTYRNLEKILNNNSIEVFGIRYTGKAFEVTCAGCDCLTGRCIEILINNDDQAKAEALEFCRPWYWMEKMELVCDWTITLDDEQIKEKLLEKNLPVQGLFCTGLAESTNKVCKTQSGRIISIKVDRDYRKAMEKEGFTINNKFTEY